MRPGSCGCCAALNVALSEQRFVHTGCGALRCVALPRGAAAQHNVSDADEPKTDAGVIARAKCVTRNGSDVDEKVHCRRFGQAHAESKLEGLEDAVRRLKAQNDELARQNQDLNNWKARLTQENYELQRQVQELDSSNGNLAKARAALQQQLDEAKARLDEESRVSRHISLIQ